MKKLAKKTLIAFILFSIAFTCFALDGIVIDVLGKVEKQSGNSWVSLKKGDVLVPGDVISTGFKSEAVISIGESTITVRALTRMTVEQLYEKNENHVSSVYLDIGSISADVKPVENKRVGFTVKTPAVTASVRGTAGDVYAYGKVECIRGTWGLSAPQEKFVIYNKEYVGQEDSNVQDIDQELDSLIMGENANNEIYVEAGEVGLVVLTANSAIQTPKDNKKDEVVNMGGSGSVSDTEIGNSSIGIAIPLTSTISVEIVIPEITETTTEQ